MKIWRLKRGGERRIRQGHPWVFAGELSHSAKEITPGELIELRDFQDHFVAYGYGHPTSQISFRKLSTLSKEKDLLTSDFFRDRLQRARAHRLCAGWADFSHRWLFAEGDGVPGLIVDAFKTEGLGWVVVVQASTAGMQNSLPSIFEALQSFADQMTPLTIVEAPNSRSRVLEGLSVEEKKVVLGPADLSQELKIELMDGLLLKTDLLKGQKTGFFLDQQWNAGLLKQMMMRMSPRSKSIRVLDICCYVGQWSSHVAQVCQKLKVPIHVTLMDASPGALAAAESNAQSYGAEVVAIEDDVMKGLSQLESQSFDLVICDPPAFVKKKADLDSGLRAYVKLNREALKTLRPGGLYVASSCSGLVKMNDWSNVLKESSLKSGRSLRQLFMGGHGPDHPLKPEFPEGEYLKCVVSRAEAPF